MKSRTKYFIFIAVFAVALLSLSAAAFADSDYYVNADGSVLPRFFEGVYAIGGGEAAPLMSDQVYALSAGGLQLLGSAASGGGGGLRYDDGTISIADNVIRIGLFYSYSEARDSGVESSVLENTDGAGFSIGYYEGDAFVYLAQTDENRIVVRPGADRGVYVTGAAGEELIGGMDSTDKSRYLIVRPEPFASLPLTSCAGNRYYGEFGFAALADLRLTVVNRVDMEHYVMGVCASEMTESWPVEALKAQAVCARTYAQRMVRSSVYHYSCGFDLTADTYCQVYRGIRGVGENITRAVLETENQYLTSGNALIDAVYSASDGGATEDGENVYGNALSYLIGVIDPYEAAAAQENPYSEWKVTMTPAQLGSKVGLGPIQRVTPTYSRVGNVIKLEFVSTGGETATLLRDRCRTTMGLKSIRYEITQDSAGNFVFTGGGFGHNMGLSQWGAYAMAKYYEKDYRFILGFYYTGVGLSYGVTE